MAVCPLVPLAFVAMATPTVCEKDTELKIELPVPQNSPKSIPVPLL